MCVNVVMELFLSQPHHTVIGILHKKICVYERYRRTQISVAFFLVLYIFYSHFAITLVFHTKYEQVKTKGILQWASSDR